MATQEEILQSIQDCRKKEEVLLAIEQGFIDVLRTPPPAMSDLERIYECREVTKHVEAALKRTGIALGVITATRRELESLLSDAEYGLFTTDDNGEITNILNLESKKTEDGSGKKKMRVME